MKLYADDNWILFRNENFSWTEKHLNTDFNSLYEWFKDNKLFIHLGEDKTKCILFKKGNKQHPTRRISKNENKIKQYSVIEYLGCLLDENMSGKPMAKRTLTKIMQKQNVLYLK